MDQNPRNYLVPLPLCQKIQQLVKPLQDPQIPLIVKQSPSQPPRKSSQQLMLKSNGSKSCLKLKTPLRLVINYWTLRGLLQSLRPQPNVQHQHYCDPRRSQTPYYLRIEPTLHLITGSFNCRISLKLIRTTFLIPELKWHTSSAVLVVIHRHTYVRNTPRTQQTPSSLKKR